MDDKYFELADKVLLLIFQNRDKQFSSIGIQISMKGLDSKLLRKLLGDLDAYGIISLSESQTTVGQRIKLTSLGLKIAPTKGAYRQFISENKNEAKEPTVSIKELYIGDKIKNSKIKNFKTNKTILKNTSEKIKLLGFLEKFWLPLLITIIGGTILLAIEYKWFK